MLSSPEARREAEMGAAEVGEPPEPDHARTPAGCRHRSPTPSPSRWAGPPAAGACAGGSPQVLALALVWVLLWGSVSAAAIVGGLLVGLAVTAIFPLPLLPERLRSGRGSCCGCWRSWPRTWSSPGSGSAW